MGYERLIFFDLIFFSIIVGALFYLELYRAGLTITHKANASGPAAKNPGQFVQ